MSARLARNLIAFLMVVLWVALMLVFAGCSSISMEKGSKGTDSYEKITFRGPPKDWKALDFKFGENTRLKAGEAATSEQPWVDVVSGFGTNAKEISRNVKAYCKAYPAMCDD